MTPNTEHPFPTQTSTDMDDSSKASTPPNPDGKSADLLQRVVQGAHQTIDRMADTAAPHVQRMQEGMHSAGDMLNHRGEQVRDMGDEWAESLRATVRENPLAAVAAAVALGLLVARLTR